MTDYDVLDQVARDRIAEVIDDLANDTRFIDDVIGAADVANSNAAVDRVIKFIRDAADAVVEL